MVFLTFDREALLDTMAEKSLFWGNTWEKSDTGTGGSRAANQFTNLDTTYPSSKDKQVMRAEYMDQIPNFDVKLIAMTERGHGAIMELIGVEILNAGSGVSIDDITTDVATTWIGTRIKPWHTQTYNAPGDGTNGTYAPGSEFKFSGNTAGQVNNK